MRDIFKNWWHKQIRNMRRNPLKILKPKFKDLTEKLITSKQWVLDKVGASFGASFGADESLYFQSKIFWEGHKI